jgi:hypothetical protein
LSAIAHERQRELQRRWGILSCQRTLLPAAPRLFAALQEGNTARSNPAPSAWTASLRLGEYRFDLLLADESAKLNMNAVYHHRGRAGVERFVHRSVPALFRPPVRLAPEVTQGKPLEELMAGDDLPDAFHSWGQVFDFSLATQSQAERWRMPQWTARMTLWGRGPLNVRRASDAAIIEACQLVASEGAARRFLNELRNKPKHQVDVLVKQLDVDQEKQVLLQEMLTEYSSSFSLWTTACAKQVEAQRFSVLQVDEQGLTRTTDFVF